MYEVIGDGVAPAFFRVDRQTGLVTVYDRSALSFDRGTAYLVSVLRLLSSLQKPQSGEHLSAFIFSPSTLHFWGRGVTCVMTIHCLFLKPGITYLVSICLLFSVTLEPHNM